MPALPRPGVPGAGRGAAPLPANAGVEGAAMPALPRPGVLGAGRGAAPLPAPPRRPPLPAPPRPCVHAYLLNMSCCHRHRTIHRQGSGAGKRKAQNN